MSLPLENKFGAPQCNTLDKFRRYDVYDANPNGDLVLINDTVISLEVSNFWCVHVYRKLVNICQRLFCISQCDRRIKWKLAYKPRIHFWNGRYQEI